MREKMQQHHAHDTHPKSNVELVSAQIKQRRDELKTQIDVIADNFAEEYAKHLKRNQKLRVKLPKFKTAKTKSTEVEKLFGTIKIKWYFVDVCSVRNGMSYFSIYGALIFVI